MPIRSQDRDLYPDDWDEISKRIRLYRARGRCECTGQCGHAHPGERCGAFGDVRRRTDEPHIWERARKADGPGWAEPIRIVICTAHLDRDPTNCDDDNLLAMCQICHLRYDGASRAVRTAQVLRERRRE